MARIICSWRCRLLAGNIGNGIAFKKFLLKIAYRIRAYNTPLLIKPPGKYFI